MEFLHKIGEVLAALSTQQQIAVALAGAAFLLLLLMVVLLRRPHEESGQTRNRRSRRELSTRLAPVIIDDTVERFTDSVATDMTLANSVATASDSFVEQLEVPEDSILRRHYLTELAARQPHLDDACPTDSILRRHYLQLKQAQNEA